MVFQKISSDLKECGLRLWEAGWSLTDLCDALCVSPASLYRWRELKVKFDCATRPRSLLQGRPRIIGLAAMNAIKEIYSEHPDTYLDELQWFLAIQYDIRISIAALQVNLMKAGLTRKVLHKIACERDEARRAVFRQVIQHQFSGTGREFVVVDESSKNEHTLARHYGRSFVGQPATISGPFICGQRYSLAAAMTTDGYLAAHVRPGSFDSFAFFDFIVEDVVRYLKYTGLFDYSQ